MTTTDVKYKVNHRVFMQFYRQEKAQVGSERKLAESLGLSHTTLQLIRNRKDSRGIPKTHVNLATARLIEAAWGIPKDVAFVPEVVGDSPTTAAA